MSEELRDLTISDHSAVTELCMGIWGGNDYVPHRFPSWIDDVLSHPFGIFLGDALQAIGNLEIKPNYKTAWIKGLRVREAQRRKGLASRLVDQMILRAKDNGLETLRYATSSRNIASMKLAENLGFQLRNNIRYFRLEPPFPPHPRPSPSINPLQIGTERLHEILENSDIIPSDMFAIRWEFHKKDIKSLQAIMEKERAQVVFGNAGDVDSLTFSSSFERDDQKTTVFSIFSKNRTVFVDIFSRALDYLESTNTERAAFFLGPRVEEWVDYIIEMPKEFADRRFLLYEKRIEKN
ncbi:MAG: GNAT family N-acetyltransferase [Candidatus Thorarchaeota archaeon]|jgi:GNAT superfamily N-acetyltransferase